MLSGPSDVAVAMCAFVHSKHLPKPGVSARELHIAYGPHCTPSAALACSSLDPLLGPEVANMLPNGSKQSILTKTGPDK